MPTASTPTGQAQPVSLVSLLLDPPHRTPAATRNMTANDSLEAAQEARNRSGPSPIQAKARAIRLRGVAFGGRGPRSLPCMHKWRKRVAVASGASVGVFSHARPLYLSNAGGKGLKRREVHRPAGRPSMRAKWSDVGPSENTKLTYPEYRERSQIGHLINLPLNSTVLGLCDRAAGCLRTGELGGPAARTPRRRRRYVGRLPIRF